MDNCEPSTSGLNETTVSTQSADWASWASSVETVLNDADGCHVFLQHLEKHHKHDALAAAHFYYAHRALSAMTKSLNAKHIEKIAAHFLRANGKEPLSFVSSDLKEQIERQLQTLKQRNNADLNIFAPILDDCLHVLRFHHACFVQSDDYIRAIQRFSGHTVVESPPDNATVSDDESDRPRMLNESDEASNSSTEVRQVSALTTSTASNTLPKKASVKLTPEVLMASIPQRSSTLNRPSKKLPNVPHPYHTDYVPHLPVSVRDSAVSSQMSSETDSQRANHPHATHRPLYERSRREQERHLQNMHLQRNREDVGGIIPRTQWDRDAGRTDHKNRDVRIAFANELITRLKKLEKEMRRGRVVQSAIKEICTANSASAKRDVVSRYAQLGQLSDDEHEILDAHVSSWSQQHRGSAGSPNLAPPRRNVQAQVVPAMTSSMHATASVYADTSGIETGSSEASAFTSSLAPFQLNAFAHKMSRSAVVNKRVTYTLSYTLPSGDAMPFKTTLDGHPYVTLKQIKKLLPSKLRSNVVYYFQTDTDRKLVREDEAIVPTMKENRIHVDIEALLAQ